MKESKLIEILKTFTPEEMKHLEGFILKQSDKKNTLPHKLFTLLHNYYPEFSEKVIVKEKVYNKIFSDKKFNDNKLSKLMTELTKLIEQYIVHSKRQQNIADEKMNLLRFYFERNLDKYYIATARELKQILDDLPYGTYQNIMNYQYEELMTTYNLKLNTRVANYSEVYNELNEFIETETLRWENMSLMEPFPEVYKIREKRPFYIIHHLLNQMILKDDESYFFEAMLIAENNLHKFAEEESREILRLLLFFSIKKINSGFASYYEQQLRIYTIFIRLNLILNQYGKISLATYKNYINAALRLNKIKEAELFLETYKDYLIEETKEEAYGYNKACLYFEKKKYNEVIDIILNTKQNDIYYNLSQRRLLLKTYYELMQENKSYYSLLESSIQSFKKFISVKNNIEDQHILLNKNFLKIMQRLLDVNTKNDAISLYDEYKKLNLMTEKLWLENKIKDLIK